ncbi:MAG TPA: nucleoside-diphosphate sugar epimerase/dehydratase [Verrucomicrobiae bacterium]|nr:nucleoside-diphosphate sugar epimerase/dehydratase [Verrucomicrobiae bacterium]
MNTWSAEYASRTETSAAGAVKAAAAGAWQWATAAHRFLLVLLTEIFLAAVSYSLAVVALADTREPGWSLRVLSATILLLIFCRFAGLASVRLYRRSLHYASIPDLISIAKAVSFTTALFWALAAWEFHALRIPAAVFLLDWAFLQILWAGLHFGVRVVKAQQAAGRKSGKRVLIVGAGNAGMMLLKEMALDSDPDSSCRPVAMVDDDSSKWGRSFFGVPVVGGTRDLARLAAGCDAEEILICIPSATPSQMRDILDSCRLSGVPARTLPTLSEIVDGRVSRRDLRPPHIHDLLQRDEIRMEPQEVRRIVGGKTVLVTGAGGSIGSELCRQIAAASPRKLLLLDKSENSLFYVNLEISEILDSQRVQPVLADLVCRDRVREILETERPDIIFHAAAHKHVGLLELHPQEAIRNNVLGARILAEAALQTGVPRLVNISTDKAVYPRSYMGLSKKLAELCIQDLARTHRAAYMNVRFGNVAGSTGSVLRLFWDQIQKGGPIRVTDPRATRYFMSVPEAVHLILRAASLGAGGETFVFDMGEPLNIYELAKTMSLFAGLKPGRDLPIEFTGLRDGEKIVEDLWEGWERPQPTSAAGILVVTEPHPLSPGILGHIAAMEECLLRDDQQGLLDCLDRVVPEFAPSRSGASGRQSVSTGPLPGASSRRVPAALSSMGAA